MTFKKKRRVMGLQTTHVQSEISCVISLTSLLSVLLGAFLRPSKSRSRHQRSGAHVSRTSRANGHRHRVARAWRPNENDTNNMDALKVARAVTPFTVDNKCHALQQKDLLAYVRELTTQLNFPRNYRQHDFDIALIALADFYEPMPKDGGRSTHAPTKTREDLATVLALTMKDNASAIVQDTDDETNGVAIFGKLAKTYGQSGGGAGGAAYLLQLKQLSFYETGDVTVLASKFVAICNDYHSTTESAIPAGIQRTSLLNAPRTRGIVSQPVASRWQRAHPTRSCHYTRASCRRNLAPTRCCECSGRLARRSSRSTRTRPHKPKVPRPSRPSPSDTTSARRTRAQVARANTRATRTTTNGPGTQTGASTPTATSDHPPTRESPTRAKESGSGETSTNTAVGTRPASTTAGETNREKTNTVAEAKTDAKSAPTRPLHDSTISESETRLHRPTLINQVQNPNARSWTPTVQYVEIFAGVGSMLSATEAQSGEIAVLTEKEPAVRENLRHCFPDAKIFHDIDDDSDWSKFERRP